MGIALLLHSLAATIWVGGMFFLVACLRPASAALEPAARVQVLAGSLQRFFAWVLGSMAVLLATGLWMAIGFLGGFKQVGLYVHLMFGLGLLMMLLGLHAYFAPFRRLQRHVAAGQWAEAGRDLNRLRLFIGLNLALGLVVVAIGSGGRYLLN